MPVFCLPGLRAECERHLRGYAALRHRLIGIGIAQEERPPVPLALFHRTRRETVA